MIKKRSYTTGDVAKFCDVSTKSVMKWFDDGKLTGYRLPPSGGQKGDRRIPHDDLIGFMARNGMPIPKELE